MASATGTTGRASNVKAGSIEQNLCTSSGSSHSINIYPPQSPTRMTKDSILKLAGAFHGLKTSRILFCVFSYSMGEPCGRSFQVIMYFISFSSIAFVTIHPSLTGVGGGACFTGLAAVCATGILRDAGLPAPTAERLSGQFQKVHGPTRAFQCGQNVH